MKVDYRSGEKRRQQKLQLSPQNTVWLCGIVHYLPAWNDVNVKREERTFLSFLSFSNII